MLKTLAKIVVCIGLTFLLCRVAQAQAPSVQVPSQVVEYSEFKASLPKTVRGAYLVEGDLPIYLEADLEKYYADYINPSASPSKRSKIIVNQRRDQDYGTGTWRTADNVWSTNYKNSLSYCIGSSFTAQQKADLIKALASASRAWQKAANVRFVYKSEEDSNCNEFNNNVLFNIASQPNKIGLAAAFYPDNDANIDAHRTRRTLFFAPLAFTTMGYTLLRTTTHELGHILGFMHEFIDQKMTREGCSGENNGKNRARITTYDPYSIMTYLNCNGGVKADAVSEKDYEGASELYGEPLYLHAELDFGGAYGSVNEGTPVDNPATGAQSCPNGYIPWQVFGTPDTDWFVFLCYRTHSDSNTPMYDFGGMWGYVNEVSTPNPLTGKASCPDGFADLKVLGTSNRDWPLHVCYRAHIANQPMWFGGVIGTVNQTTVENPATERVSCPVGYQSQKVLGTNDVDWPLTYCYAIP